jgi:cytochrome c oxidase subunit 4
MSAPAADSATAEVVVAAHEHAHEHPSDKRYVVIALVLAVLTGLEVLTYFVNFHGAAKPMLLIMMAAKFVIVAAMFMHLKFDSKVFRRFLITGIILSCFCYVGVFLIFGFWGN